MIDFIEDQYIKHEESHVVINKRNAFSNLGMNLCKSWFKRHNIVVNKVKQACFTWWDSLMNPTINSFIS